MRHKPVITERMCNQLDGYKREMARIQNILNHEPLENVLSVRNSFAKRLDKVVAKYQKKFKIIYDHYDPLLDDYLNLNSL